MALTDNLTAHWKLDEPSGSRADSVGTATLSDINTVTSTPGKLATAARFARASEEYLRGADSAALSLGDVSFTIALWVRLASVTAVNTLIGKGNGATSYGSEYILYVTSGNLTWTVRNGENLGLLTFPTALDAATWYFVVARHDAAADVITLQVNNSAVSSTAWAGGSQDTGLELALGRHPEYAGHYLDGDLESVSFWKGRALTTTDTAALWNAGTGLAYPFGAGATSGPLLRPFLRGRRR